MWQDAFSRIEPSFRFKSGMYPLRFKSGMYPLRFKSGMYPLRFKSGMYPLGIPKCRKRVHRIALQLKILQGLRWRLNCSYASGFRIYEVLNKKGGFTP
jgi:hypothetical protein